MLTEKERRSRNWSKKNAAGVKIALDQLKAMEQGGLVPDSSVPVVAPALVSPPLSPDDISELEQRAAALLSGSPLSESRRAVSPPTGTGKDDLSIKTEAILFGHDFLENEPKDGIHVNIKILAAEALMRKRPKAGATVSRSDEEISNGYARINLGNSEGPWVLVLGTPEAKAISFANMGFARRCQEFLQDAEKRQNILLDQKMKSGIQALAWILELVRLENKLKEMNSVQGVTVVKVPRSLRKDTSKARIQFRKIKDEGTGFPSDSDYAALFDRLVDLVDPRPTVEKP